MDSEATQGLHADSAKNQLSFIFHHKIRFNFLPLMIDIAKEHHHFPYM